MVQYSILFADRDPNVTQDFIGTLKANGFDAAGTTSGMEALGLYKSMSPDLVVTDLALSEMDGMTLLEEILKYDPTARVIITPDDANKDVITRAFRLGVLDVIEKPLDLETLISMIRELPAREDRALEGNLQMMSLASIIQINCEERNQAQLSLNHLGKDGIIYFKDGEMIHAETDGLVGDEAIYSLLGWEDGTFKLKMGLQPSTVTITKKWSGLLLEGMRRIDESTAAWSQDWEDFDTPTEEEKDNRIPERIVKTILTNREVTSAVICSKTGTLIAQDKSPDPESEIAFGAELMGKAESIGDFLDSGNLERIVITGSENRYYLQQQEDDLLLLSLTKRSSAETVHESVQTIYKRYQSA
ncbi:MAG: response regulator [Anaerolineales bacterium]|nr:response regulator [Anaerolineales bacterium]